MKQIINKKGQSIIEIIVAIGIFILVASGVTTLYLGAFSSNLRDKERLQADMYLQQTLEAVRSIRDHDFSNLTNGTYGLSNSNGYWEFSGSPDTLGQFTRSVTVSDVQRSSGCAIVASGGTIDTNSKKITATVSWDFEDGNSTSVSAVEYLNKWSDQTGCGEASWFTVDTSDVILAAGNKQIEGIQLENAGNESITLVSVVPTWENSNLITEFKMGDTRLWKSTGSYTPVGAQPSGVELDLIDYTLIPSGGTPEINKIRFDGSMENTFFTLLFLMSDGTARYIESFSPEAICPPQADSLTVDTGSASLGGAHNTQLLGITLENTHAECPIRIDTYTLTWSNGNLIEKIRINGSNLWVYNGAGTPDGKQATGTELDADDITLDIGSGIIDIDYFQFSDDMSGDTFNITFKMNDESTQTVSNIQP